MCVCMVSPKAGFLQVLHTGEVVEFLKKKMNQFYEECPAAWQELLDRRTNASPVALTKGYTASPGTTGLAMRILMIKSVDGLSGGGWGWGSA